MRKGKMEKTKHGNIQKKWIERDTLISCIFYDQKCSGTISILNHHLADTPGGMKACNKVPVNVKKEFQLLLKVFKDDKNKRNMMLREIGAGIDGGSNESPADEECGSNRSSVSQPNIIGPLDKFVSS
ncbi:hypothetical protein M0R45_031202 [Rubus argutus]|uniref:Uncharacterized protein n=1 Tax=Rubus argutus TaxID=59490 RepID=A0AAW1WHN3_RUBAR